MFCEMPNRFKIQLIYALERAGEPPQAVANFCWLGSIGQRLYAATPNNCFWVARFSLFRLCANGEGRMAGGSAFFSDSRLTVREAELRGLETIGGG